MAVHISKAFLYQFTVLLLAITHNNKGVVATQDRSSSGDDMKIAFGAGNPPSLHIPIVEQHQSISSKKFFVDYVLNKKAVLFKGAIKDSPAYKLWSDDYFLNLRNIPSDHVVLIESRKKENRTSPPSHMPFKEFIGVYNVTDQYMVHAVPPFLREDYMLPHHLQCHQLMMDIIVETLMWFSSGGTSSVVHTDSVENLNCVVAGRKKFVLVPYKYSDMILFDHPEGAYSGIDVDDVDYSKYPGLADVKFMHAEMEAGDCLYIPYKMIHQVRSYDRSIAVNIWWDTFKNEELDLDKCDTAFDPTWSLDKVELTGFAQMETSPAVIRDHVTGTIGKDSISYDEFPRRLGLSMLEDEQLKEEDPKLYQELELIMSVVCQAIDADKDGKLTAADLDLMSDGDWNVVFSQFRKFSDIDEELSGPPPEEGEEEGEDMDEHDEL